MKLFIGLDLGVNKAAICVLGENGGTVLQAIVPSFLARLFDRGRRQISEKCLTTA